MDAWLEIIRPDGTNERQVIEGDQVTVGRSPSAGISLPDSRELEAEHFLLAPRGDGCWISIAQGAQTPTTLNGQAFSHGMVPWGGELRVGALRFKVTDKLPEDKKTDKKKTSPVLLLALVVVPVCAFLLLRGNRSGISAEPQGEPPPLFDETVACPSDGGPARHRADRDAESAIAKGERYPFDAQDGVQAVRLFRRAQSCYRSVNAPQEAQQMEREASVLERRLDEDYRTRRLRLSRALEAQRYADALVEARALRELVRHRAGNPYVRWLQRLIRQLQLRLDGGDD